MTEPTQVTDAEFEVVDDSNGKEKKPSEDYSMKDIALGATILGAGIAITAGLGYLLFNKGAEAYTQPQAPIVRTVPGAISPQAPNYDFVDDKGVVDPRLEKTVMNLIGYKKAASEKYSEKCMRKDLIKMDGFDNSLDSAINKNSVEKWASEDKLLKDVYQKPLVIKTSKP